MRGGFDNEIAVLSPVRPGGELTTLYRPESNRFVGDVDLHWDAERLLFSMPTDNKRYEIFEIGVDGSGLRQVTPSEPDVDNYDACYLPDDRIIYDSTVLFPGRSVRGRREPGRQLAHHESRWFRHPPVVLRSGPRLVPDRDQRRPRYVHPLGVQRHAALFHASCDAHESGRHQPDGAVRQQFVLAEFDLLRPPDSRTSVQVCGRHFRAPRRARGWAN